MKQEIEVEIKP